MSAEFDSLFDCKRTPIYGVRLPEITITNELRRKFGAKDDCSNYDFLKQVCRDGFKKLNIPKEDHKKYADRFKYELETISELGLLDYVLLVWMVINFCNENGIALGRGRGSAAGSLILYLSGCTGIDPLKYGLFFERFISKIRAKKQVVDGILYLDGPSLMDVDIDVEYSRRGEVIKYLDTVFAKKTSKILTVTSLSGKILIKECGKIVDEKPESEMNEVTGMLPSLFGQVMDIKEAYETIPAFKDWCDKNPRSYKTALKLRGLIKNKGVHASGYLLSYDLLSESCPTELTSDKEVVSSYSKDWVALQNIKLDLLGLKTLSVVNAACNTIGIKFNDIDFEDSFIYQKLQEIQHAHGLFQIEADATLQVCQKVKPKNLNELSAVVSLSRPGAFVFVDKYANYVNTGTFESIHPFFDSVLKPNGGIAIYQEDLMSLAVKIGFSLDEGDTLRRIVTKKKADQVKEWKAKIEDKIKANNLPKEVGELFWSIVESSANYSFNRCIYEEETVKVLDKGTIKLRDVKIGDKIYAFDTKTGKSHFVTVKNVYTNRKECIEVSSGSISIRVSIDHKILSKKLDQHEFSMNRAGDLDWFGDQIKTLYGDTHITSIRDAFRKKELVNTIDLEVDSPDHNFYCNGIVVSNSHAAAYSTLTAATIYLKYKYPKEFFLSLLMMTRHENPQQPEIAKIQKEMRHFGMKLLPPHILKSNMDFSIEGNDIRYGLGSVKGISDKTISRLANFKSEQSNKFEVFEAAKQAGLGIGILSVLIQSGSLDGFTQTRSRVVLEAQLWNLLTEKEKGLCMTFGAECEYDLLKTIKKLSTELNEKSKPYIKPSRLETIKKKYQPYLEIYNQNKKSEPFANWFYETRALGYSYDSSLKGIFSPKMPNLINLQELSEVPEKSTVYIVGRVDETKEFTARNEKKTKTFKMSLSDEMGSINVLMFNDKIELNRSSNNNRLPEEEDVVIVKGQKMKDCIFAEVIGIQTIKIYTKLSELKDKHAEELEKSVDSPAPELTIQVPLSK